MPTIKQLPAATAVGGSDLIPLSQNGLTRSVTVSTLLGNSQPSLSLSQNTLLGRISAGLGGPEAINIGTGLALQSGSVLATAADHLSLPSATSLGSGDEIIINSGGSPKRLPAAQIRSLFSAGSGIQIDGGGMISATGTSQTGASASVGPKGDTGAQGPAGQGFNFRGGWLANTAYAAYDVVTYSGQCFVAVTSIAATATFAASSWSLLAAQGATGVVGPAGPTIPATSGAVGAVKPGSGLTVSADGTLSLTSVPLASLSQGGASVGQLLSWSGTGWVATSPSNGVSYVGAAPITVSSGVVSLGQAGAAAGQVLAWNGSNWVPQQLPASGAQLGASTPVGDGTAAPGTASVASREDHRHPTDLTRAPVAAPVFTTSLTLPSWTTTSRPTSPAPGMEGFATDTGRRETYTPSGWVQYVRLADIPAGNGQLLGGSTSAGQASIVSIGAGLSLTGGTLSATGSQTSTALTGVSIDGSLIAASPSVPYQMTTNDRVVDVNKSAGAPTKIFLPSSPVLWVDYTIIDGKGDAGTNNITIAAASGTMINGSPTFVMNANNDAISLRAVSATVWRIS